MSAMVERQGRAIFERGRGMPYLWLLVDDQHHRFVHWFPMHHFFFFCIMPSWGAKGLPMDVWFPPMAIGT